MKIDPNGNAYILEGSNNCVKKWTPGASDGTVVAGDNGIDDNNGRNIWSNGMFIDFMTMIIWIVESSNNRIVKWTSPTSSEVVCGSYGSNNDQFNYPQGLFVDTNAANILYVGDTNNHRIQMWLPGDSTGATVAGITGQYGNSANQLYYPKTLIVDSNGNMFIADTGNGRVVRWKIGLSVGETIASERLYGSSTFQLPSLLNINFDLNDTLFISSLTQIMKFIITCRKYCFR